MNDLSQTQPGQDRAAEEFGLIGHPLGHSFSAQFFADKFKREQLAASYQNFDIEQVGQLQEILAAHPLLRGLNVTIPHKQAVIPLLDEMSQEAKEIGAVNVIRITRTASGTPYLKGYNSDIIGFTRSLSPLLRPIHQKALVLGTGGASKAVVHGLKKLGITPQYVSRSPREGVLTYDDLNEEVMREHLVVVNCTPVGMYPHTQECPQIPYSLLTQDHILFDLVYNPLETLFLQKGAAQGATTKNGLEMLHLQALASWEFWHEN